MSNMIDDKIKEQNEDIQYNKTPRKEVAAMLDIECLDNKSGAAILSIGVVLFDREFNMLEDTFFYTIDLDNSLKAGLKVGGDTFYWWMQQSEGARRALFGEESTNDKGELRYKRKNLGEVLHLLTQYLQGYDIKGVWGNSARFDLGIIQDSYEALGKSIPWKFTLERDVRTIVAFRPQIKKDIVKNSKILAHDPIEDCKLQIEYLAATFDEIGELPW